MADLFDSLKKTWLKGMEAVGNTASNIAANTKQKVSEINLENRRREILADFGIAAYEMWQKGEHFPAALEHQLTELNDLDEELNKLKAERFSVEAAKKEAAEAARKAAEEAAINPEEATEDIAEEPTVDDDTQEEPLYEEEVSAETTDFEEAVSSFYDDGEAFQSEVPDAPPTQAEPIEKEED